MPITATNSARNIQRACGVHHRQLAELLRSPCGERKYPCTDDAEADVMIHSLLRLRRTYGYDIAVIKDGDAVWVCKPGSPHTQPPDGYISTHDAAEDIGLKYKTFLYRRRKLRIKSLRFGNSAYITFEDAERVRDYRGAV